MEHIRRIGPILRRVDAHFARHGEIELSAEELVPEPEPLGILQQSRADTSIALESLRLKADRLEREVAAKSDELRQARRAINALETAERLMGAN